VPSGPDPSRTNSPERTPPSKRLRLDAQRNRAAILVAAEEVFAEQGLDAPLEEVAARAGVGIATLYRRFPKREQLVAAALVETIRQYAQRAEEALAEPDPWAALVSLVEEVCSLQARDLGLGDLLTMVLPADKQVERLRQVANDHVVKLVERAKAAGQLRPDFVGEDLLLLMIANSAIAHITGQDARAASPRFVALMLEAFRADGRGALPEPPTGDAMEKAMRRMALERGCGE